MAKLLATSFRPFRLFAVRVPVALAFLVVWTAARADGQALRGVVRSEAPLPPSAVVLEVRPLGMPSTVYRGPLKFNGTFAIEVGTRVDGAMARTGWFEISLIGASGRVLHRGLYDGAAQPLSISLERENTARPVTGTVAADALRQPPSRTFVKAMRRSERAFAEGDLAESASRLAEAAILEPGRVKPLLQLGTLQLRRGKYRQALAAFERAARLDPSGEPALSGRAMALHGMGHLAAAEAQARLALDEHPGNARVHYVLGAILAAIDIRGGEAVGHLEKAAGEFPAALLTLTDVHQQRGEMEAGRETLRRCLETAPPASPVHTECATRWKEFGGLGPSTKAPGR